MFFFQNITGRISLSIRELLSATASICSIRRAIAAAIIILTFLVVFYIKYASELFALSSNPEEPALLPNKPAPPEAHSALDGRAKDSEVASGKMANQSIDQSAAAEGKNDQSIINQPFHECDGGAAPVVQTPCQRCSNYEMTSKAEYCVPTGYKEGLRCGAESVGTGKAVAVSSWRTCENVAEIEARNFSIFSGCSFASSVVLSGFVYWRHYVLARQIASRIQQRVNNDAN
ncbi:hypothetical protein BV898_02697 [Hypsibius exemplaris]|uniref:Protein JTB n=1 Tax=Hypsibius exemplaris TaxID=2072580 RepID=A0A1W0X7S2_HYPEX|nr:hypothetical protein BV898_02697 [Hypsibius exemplaris]